MNNKELEKKTKTIVNSLTYEPSHDKVFDTHAHGYNSWHVKHAVRLLASSI